MSTSNWKYSNDAETIVIRTLADGRQESCFITREDVQTWISEGNTPEPADD